MKLSWEDFKREICTSTDSDARIRALNAGTDARRTDQRFVAFRMTLSRYIHLIQPVIKTDMRTVDEDYALKLAYVSIICVDLQMKYPDPFVFFKAYLKANVPGDLERAVFRKWWRENPEDATRALGSCLCPDHIDATTTLEEFEKKAGDAVVIALRSKAPLQQSTVKEGAA